MSMLLDIKYALRLLFKSPKFTAMTLGVLVGGLSISLFTFSFLYSTIYKTLPLPEGDSARAISILIDGHQRFITAFEYKAVKDDLSSFAEFGIYDNRDVRLSVKQSGKNISGSFVRAGFFEFSRVKPLLGRSINAQDTKVGAIPVALISYGVWQRELNGDPQVLNRTMTLNGEITQIIGVMPQGYRFPNTAQVWLPLLDNIFTINAKLSDHFYAYGRLNNGVSDKQAQQELGQAIEQVYQQNVERFDLPKVHKTAKVFTFQMAQTGGDGPLMFAFLNTISWMILLLACINVGNLLLARTIEKQKETAIRAALGASNLRLISQLMWEGIIISALGGILSLLLVGAALDYTEIILHSWLPNGGSFWWHWGMDTPTVIMAIVFTFITVFLSSFLPAWRSANQDISSTLRDGTRGARSKKAGRLSRILVTTQVFLVAILMLIGSVSGFVAHKLINLETGDDFTHVMKAMLTVPENKYPQQAQQISLLTTLIAAIKQQPQVDDVVSYNWIGDLAITIAGRDYASDDDKHSADTLSSVGDLTTIGVGLVAGRQFNDQDKKGAPYTVMISQSMAKRYWPGESPLGKNISIKIEDKNTRFSVIGVVTDRMNPKTLFGQLDSADEVYVSGLQFFTPYQILYYRVFPNAQHSEEIFYRAVFNTDRSIELDYGVEDASINRNKMHDVMALMSNITLTTGLFALLLAMVGIYGLTANTVAQRTHEVGIRRALGASDKLITQMFLKQGARQLFIGLSLALVCYALIATGFHHFTEKLFPVSFYFMLALVVTAMLSVIVLFAIYTPTKRAIKLEPSVALRYE